jgi:hypothetical protein
MNKLDLLKEKKLKHAERLTVLEKIILACPDPRLMLEAAAELAAKDEAIQSLTDVVNTARGKNQETVKVSQIETIVDDFMLEKARVKDHSKIKHS